MSKQKIILLGGGGHCRSCIDVIESTGRFEIAGILDKQELVSQKVLDYFIIDTDDHIDRYVKPNYWFLVTVGQIKYATIRKRLFNILRENRARIATIVSPLAYVSKYAMLQEGVIVMNSSFVNAGALIRENSILNSGCIIEHDSVVGEHTHISTGAVVNGDCIIGNETFIGSNSTILNQIEVGNNIVVGANSLVKKSILTAGIYVGNPIRKLDHE